jgi:hypothetical protein
MSKDLVFSGEQPLSEKQKLFNEYSRQIDRLNEKMGREKDRLDALKTEFHKDIHQLFEKLSRERIELAVLFHEATYDFKFSNSQLEIFGDVIVFLFEQAFESIDPTDEQEIIFQQWKGQTYSNLQSEDIYQLKQKISDQLLLEHGIYINIDDYANDLEGFTQFRKEVQIILAEKDFSKKKKKKKSKKEEKVDQEKEAEVAIQQRNIRSIYISLAKVLHPDISQNSMDSSEKEELMKKVTLAYQLKDLHTLLVLEREWVSSQNLRMDQLEDQQLDIYLQSLKERMKALEQEIEALYQSPIYSEIAHLIHLQEKKALQKIKSQRSELKYIIQNFQHNLSILKQYYSRKDIQNAVNEFYELIGHRE